MGQYREWADVARETTKSIESGGFENFKQTGINEFFQSAYSGIHPPFTYFLLSRADWRDLLKIIFSKKKIINFKGSVLKKIIHKIHLAMLCEYVRENDDLGLLNIVEEPEYGNPTMFIYGN